MSNCDRVGFRTTYSHGCPSTVENLPPAALLTPCGNCLRNLQTKCNKNRHHDGSSVRRDCPRHCEVGEFERSRAVGEEKQFDGQ
jgi:hypothetical protein